jgi:hypothetical protein
MYALTNTYQDKEKIIYDDIVPISIDVCSMDKETMKIYFKNK